VRAKLGATQARRHREEAEWDAAHPERPDVSFYREHVLPGLALVPVSRIARVTGLSLAYCADQAGAGCAAPHVVGDVAQDERYLEG
jgi:hypothetical protein